jgi:hypothetical protein
MKWCLSVVVFLSLAAISQAQRYTAIPTDPTPGDQMLAEYFAHQSKGLAEACLSEIQTPGAWNDARGLYREQLFEMLGISPCQPRTDLSAQVTGTQQHDDITIENLVFQSLPGLYVTANFYRPSAESEKSLPAILYVCGHSSQKARGISFGNKTAYHHHGVWFAKHGYACLMIDTFQLGEIGGTHHGTYRHERWWWNSRGYTPAGVEAWNGIRALDYLQSRPEVDAERIGMTGRSGGGAYTWWVSALDERVKVAVPVAGITSLHNHVVDGVVEGHCDCMFHVNTYRWDFPQVAALIAPRPLLIANTDKDKIFPLDGVVDVYDKTRRIYELLGAGDKIGLAITEGPHKDTQPLRTVAFEWFERHLKGRAATDEFDSAAPKVLGRTTMRALGEVPADEIVTNVDQRFVAMAPEPKVPSDEAEWKTLRESWMKNLGEKVFRAWPGASQPLSLEEVKQDDFGGMLLTHYEFEPQPGIRLPLVLVRPGGEFEGVSLKVIGSDEAWLEQSADRFGIGRRQAALLGSAIVFFAPRGIGPTAWTPDARERIHIRRRFMLLGQTLDGMRVWDIRRAIAALGEIQALKGTEVHLDARQGQACNALYASLFEPKVNGMSLGGLESSHHDGKTDYLNVLRYFDIPQALAMAAEKTNLTLIDGAEASLRYPSAVIKKLTWPTRITNQESDP